MAEPIRDLHILPKVRDSWSYLYVEHARIDQDGRAIAIHDVAGRTPVPCASLTTLVLGPGTTVTHAAIRTLADSGCLVLWTGEEAVRFYAAGFGETRSSANLQRQIALWADPVLRLEVVRRMYRMRFRDMPSAGATLQQLRGMEGARVRLSYQRFSKETGVPWSGRQYKFNDWGSTDTVNRALSCANSCLYGVCSSAIIAAGYSPAIGFIHTGRQLSFTYDIADLFKTETAIPAAFRAAVEGDTKLETRVRHHMRDLFRESRLLARIIPAIDTALGFGGETSSLPPIDLDSDPSQGNWLWDPDAGTVDGGVNFAAPSDAAETDSDGAASPSADELDVAAGEGEGDA